MSNSALFEWGVAVNSPTANGSAGHLQHTLAVSSLSPSITLLSLLCVRLQAQQDHSLTHRALLVIVEEHKPWNKLPVLPEWQNIHTFYTQTSLAGFRKATSRSLWTIRAQYTNLISCNDRDKDCGLCKTNPEIAMSRCPVYLTQSMEVIQPCVWCLWLR